jgi:hypothetical protein
MIVEFCFEVCALYFKLHMCYVRNAAAFEVHLHPVCAVWLQRPVTRLHYHMALYPVVVLVVYPV